MEAQRVRDLSKMERSITEAVSADRLMADTEAIARWVRLSGTDDEAKSFDYVEDVLRELGLETTRYLGQGYISLPESAHLGVEGTEVHAITHSMVPDTPDGGLELPLIYVGRGTKAEYSTREVQGKIALVDGIAIPGKAQAAQEAGAAACVFANSDEHVHEMIVSTVWGSPTPETRERLPKIPVVSVGSAAAETLLGILGRKEEPMARLVTRVRTGWTEIPTLTAQVDGNEEPEKFVLFSGHIDSWHHGAMDNGSADALMLETLRVLLPHRENFRRSLRLAFWSGHSHGRYAGSTWYADHLWEDLNDNCVLHLNTDSPGGRGATVITEGQAMAESRGLAADVIRSLTGEEFNGSRFGRSGDQSFMSLGIPSLFMFVSEQPPGQDESAGDVAELLGGPGAKGGGVGWWWHTTEDLVDKLDPELLMRDTRIYAAVAHRLLADTLLPLDLRASAEELLGHLRDWQEKAGDRFDLAGVVSRAEEVAGLADSFQDLVESATGSTQPRMERAVNEVIRRAASELVRLDYARSDLFDQDPAVGQPPIPLLAPVDELLSTAVGSDSAQEWLTLLVRNRNRLLYGLSGAKKSLESGLDLLSGKGS